MSVSRSHIIIPFLVGAGVFLIPLSYYEIFSFDTIGYTGCDLCMTLAIVYALKRLIWNGDDMFFRPTVYNISLILLLIWIFCAGINPLLDGDRSYVLQYLKSSAHFIFFAMFAVIASAWRSSAKVIYGAIKAVVYSSIPLNLYAFYQLPARAFDLPFANLEITSTSMKIRGSLDVVDQITLQFEGFFRATSIFSEPSGYAGFNSLVLLLLLVPFIVHNEYLFKRKAMFGFTLIITIIGLFISYSLTAILFTSCIIGSLLLIERSKRIISLMRYMLITIAFLVVTDVIIESYADVSVWQLYRERVEGIVSGGKKEGMMGESIDGRAQANADAMSVWDHFLIAGTGTGCLIHAHFSDIEPVMFSTSGYVEGISTLGIVGGGLFILFQLGLIITGMRVYSYHRRRGFALDRYHAIIVSIIPYYAVFHACKSISVNTLISLEWWCTTSLLCAMFSLPAIYARDEYLGVRLIKKGILPRIRHTFLVHKQVEQL